MSKLNEFELNEYRQEVVSKFDEWLMRTENRGISYGELAHFENLNEQELAEIEQELEQELASIKQG